MFKPTRRIAGGMASRPATSPRREERVAVQRSGTICIDGGSLAVGVTVRDINRGGARVSVLSRQPIPPQILFVVRSMELACRAEHDRSLAEAAWDGLSDVATTPCRRPAIESAWLAQVSEAGTLVLGIDESPNPRLPGLVVTLRETEGRRGPCRLTLCRDVREALLLDWLDQPSGSLPVIDGAVEIPLRGHDLKRVFVALA